MCWANSNWKVLSVNVICIYFSDCLVFSAVYWIINALMQGRIRVSHFSDLLSFLWIPHSSISLLLLSLFVVFFGLIRPWDLKNSWFDFWCLLLYHVVICWRRKKFLKKTSESTEMSILKYKEWKVIRKMNAGAKNTYLKMYLTSNKVIELLTTALVSNYL